MLRGPRRGGRRQQTKTPLPFASLKNRRRGVKSQVEVTTLNIQLIPKKESPIYLVLSLEVPLNRHERIFSTYEEFVVSFYENSAEVKICKDIDAKAVRMFDRIFDGIYQHLSHASTAYRIVVIPRQLCSTA